MRIHYTYRGDDWIRGTVIIEDLKEYYAGSRKCMRRLNVIPSRDTLDTITRVKPYANTLHVHKT